MKKGDRQMRRICIINQKGGVAKTTTTVNLAAGLARMNRKVLVIDLDPQGNISSSLNVEAKKDMYHFLIEKAELDECVTHLGHNFDVVRSKETLTKAEIILAGEQSRETLLRRKLEKIKDYDYVIVDCPPSLGLLSQNAMLFADEAIVPVSTDVLGFDGLQKQISAIQTINEIFDHNIKVSLIVPTLFDSRINVCRDVLSKIQNEYYELVSEPIRINSKLKEAPGAKCSIFKYDAKSRGAADYMNLVRTVIRQEPRMISVTMPEQEKEAIVKMA